MNIAIVTVWYNDPSIIRMIESIPKEWPIIISYGLFTDSKAKEDLTLYNRVLLYPNVTIVERNGLEVDIRNRYMEEMKGFDYCLMMDSDEFITRYDETEFEESITSLEHDLHMIRFTGDIVNGRFFVNPSQWRYFKSHKFITDGKVTRSISKGGKTVDGIVLGYNEDMRSKELQDVINDYQDKLWEYESDHNIDRLSKVLQQ